MPSLLVVEDEIKLAELLRDYFLAEAFDVHMIHDGNHVIQWVHQNSVDAVLLDLMLPGKDGVEICRELRKFTDIPILMVTARVDEVDRLIGLEVGADDYICKPFSPKEVVARVKAFLRRVNANVVTERRWNLDEGRLEFSYEGRNVMLTATEFHMMAKLCGDPGRIYSRSQLMEEMYADHRVVSERTVDSHVKKLRAKLHEAFSHIDFIESVYGVGYRLIELER